MLSLMKNLIRGALRPVGLEVVRATTIHRDLPEHLGQILKAKQIDAVIDVGANLGQFGQSLREAGFTGHIYSFEPVTHVFERLQKAAEGDERWHCFKVALSDTAGRQTINVYASHVFSSFLTANDYARDKWTSLEEVRQEEVEVARLDEMFEELPHRAACRRWLLKMDTQGFDIQVFRGASGMLDQVEALLSELALVPIYDGMADPYAQLREFNERGFFVSGMYPINRDPSLAVIEFDVTLVRASAVKQAMDPKPVGKRR